MADHHKEHPEYSEMSIFAGYGEFDDAGCSHIGVVSISKKECQCMDCLRIWPKRSDFKSDWPEMDRG